MNPFPRTLILGHRGSPRESPENTLEGFGRAILASADGVELDIQRSLDGVPIVIHDDSLERVWGIRREVSRLAWPAIQQLSAARVPSFEQVAAWAAACGAWLNVELKAADSEEGVLRLLNEFGLRDRSFISSFDPEILRAVGRIDDGMRRFFLTDRWDDEALAGFERSGAAGICLGNDGASSSALEDLSRRGLPVVVWTVNEPNRVDALLRAGVAGIISDLPAMAARRRDLLALS